MGTESTRSEQVDPPLKLQIREDWISIVCKQKLNSKNYGYRIEKSNSEVLLQILQTMEGSTLQNGSLYWPGCSFTPRYHSYFYLRIWGVTTEKFSNVKDILTMLLPLNWCLGRYSAGLYFSKEIQGSFR